MWHNTTWGLTCAPPEDWKILPLDPADAEEMDLLKLESKEHPDFHIEVSVYQLPHTDIDMEDVVMGVQDEIQQSHMDVDISATDMHFPFLGREDASYFKSCYTVLEGEESSCEGGREECHTVMFLLEGRLLRVTLEVAAAADGQEKEKAYIVWRSMLESFSLDEEKWVRAELRLSDSPE